MNSRLTSFLLIAIFGLVVLTVLAVTWLATSPREPMALMQAAGVVMTFAVTILGMLGWRQAQPVPDGGANLTLTRSAVDSMISGKIPEDVIEELQPELRIVRLVLQTLEVRGISVPEDVRVRISSTTDRHLLLRYLSRAARCERAEHVIREEAKTPPLGVRVRPPVLGILALCLISCQGLGGPGAVVGKTLPCLSRVLPAATLSGAREALAHGSAADPSEAGWRAAVGRWLPTVTGGLDAGLCALEQLAGLQTQGRDHGQLVSALRREPAPQDCEVDENRRNGCLEARAQRYLDERRARPEPPPTGGH